MKKGKTLFVDFRNKKLENVIEHNLSVIIEGYDFSFFKEPTGNFCYFSPQDRFEHIEHTLSYINEVHLLDLIELANRGALDLKKTSNKLKLERTKYSSFSEIVEDYNNNKLDLTLTNSQLELNEEAC